jgi:hypothetical protein
MSGQGPTAAAHERPGPQSEGKHATEIVGVVTKPLEEVSPRHAAA